MPDPNAMLPRLRRLLDAGVAVDPLMTEDGSSPCMIAMFLAERDADAPHIKIVELLLRAGVHNVLLTRVYHTLRGDLPPRYFRLLPAWSSNPRYSTAGFGGEDVCASPLANAGFSCGVEPYSAHDESNVSAVGVYLTLEHAPGTPLAAAQSQSWRTS